MNKTMITFLVLFILIYMTLVGIALKLAFITSAILAGAVIIALQNKKKNKPITVKENEPWKENRYHPMKF